LRWAFIGPLETADFGGLDIWKSVDENLAPVLSKEIKIPAFVGEKVKQTLKAPECHVASQGLVAPLWME
jgi:3-hydroxyacyl-CoA dehydrogenase